jgi:hypothetical protein
VDLDRVHFARARLSQLLQTNDCIRAIAAAAMNGSRQAPISEMLATVLGSD